MPRGFLSALLVFVAGCGAVDPHEDGGLLDSGAVDTGTLDAGTVDAGTVDAGAGDGGLGGDSGQDAWGDAGGGLAEAMDGIMGPSFVPSPPGLERCVGGVAVVVTPTGTLVRGYGASARGGDAAPTGSTLYPIGSLTKAFTGLALAAAEERGEVGFDSNAGEILAPDLAGVASRWPTLGQLVTHHAGLAQYPSNLVDRDRDGERDPGIDPRSPAAGYSRANLARELSDWGAPSMAPYEYSNTGIALVAIALQDQLGRSSFDDLLSAELSTVLGLSSTWGQVEAVPASARARLAEPQSVSGGTRVPGILGEMGVLAGAGEMVSSGDDLARVLEALVGVRETALAPAIARALSARAAALAGRSMGYGLELERRGGALVFHKAGNVSGFSAYLQGSRDTGVGVAVLSSCGAFMRVSELADELYVVSGG